jgi:hypothetical protein
MTNDLDTHKDPKTNPLIQFQVGQGPKDKYAIYWTPYNTFTSSRQNKNPYNSNYNQWMKLLHTKPYNSLINK